MGKEERKERRKKGPLGNDHRKKRRKCIGWVMKVSHVKDKKRKAMVHGT